MTTSDGAPAADLGGCELLVGVCGGIAAYKIGEVVSALVQRGAGITVAMTKAGRRFVGKTTFEALTGRRVLTSLWDPDETADCPHIRLTLSADLILIAPATANIIGKIAAGIADDVVSTLVISSPGPVVLAPAMNEQMWRNPIVEANVRRLSDLGYHLVGPGEGWFACRTEGRGRMAEPQDILNTIVGLLKERRARK